uniref:Neutral protease 2 n=1 Tax=Moniliophthora roreri TaxID=221103 RepID=A0A0W0FW62_MONRR
MLLSATFAAAIASSALANPVKRADGLSVKVTGPSSKLTNNGPEAVKVLKYGTVLDSLPTRSFTVSKDGTPVNFSGVKLSVALNNDNAYTTIEAGKTVSVTHEVASLFDFATAGTGKFSFLPNTDFRVTGVQQQVSHPAALSKASAASEAIEVEQASFIESSYTESKELASLASGYVSSNGAEDELFQAYFGGNDVSSVTGVLDKVTNEDDSSRTLSCVDEHDVCDGNVIAYTLVATTDIYYCDIFFDEVATDALCGSVTVNDRKIRGGTTLHEASPGSHDTDDVIYGCPDDQALSDSEKISNADNFNCFVTQVYADTKC